MLPVADEKMPTTWINRHDNAPNHLNNEAREQFNDQAVRFLPWPVRSPDLNPIENIWR